MLRDRLSALLAPRFVVGEELPAGGMARVFAGHDPGLDRPVVIKVLPPERATAVAVERFRREARLLARLSHPHVVPVLDSGDGQGVFWFVMPRVTGEPLDVRLTRGPLAEAEVRRIGGELLDALSHAHQLGVVHRDIKPGNVLLHAGHAVLADFGVALLRDRSEDQITDVGQAVGTLAYMAPEQRRGEGDARSDCWSLAATLYEAATGRRWEEAVLGEPWQELPPALVPVLRRALTPDPADRWRDASAFRAALIGGGSPRFSPWWLALAAGAALAVGAGAMWTAARPSNPMNPADTVDLWLGPGPNASDRTAEVARQAELMLQWLPNIRTAVPGSESRPARIRVQLLDRFSAGDTVLVVVAHDLDGVLLDDMDIATGTGLGTNPGRLVARRIVAAFFPTRLVEFDLLDRSRDDVQAWRAHWRGLTAFQQGRFAEAEAAFDEGLQRDATFVVAIWGRLLARMWQREDVGPDLERLMAVVERLPPPINALVRAQHDADIHRRLAVFDSIALAHPHYGPGRMLHANELFHRGPLVGRGLADGVAAFVAARREVPDLDHVNTSEQVLWGAIRLGDEVMARAELPRLRDHPDRVRQQLLLLAFDARFQPLAATVRRSMMQLLPTRLLETDAARYLRLGLQFDLPVEQRRFATLLAHRTDDPGLMASARAARATALLMEGRPDAATAALAAAEASTAEPLSYRLQRIEWHLLLPLIGLPTEPVVGATALAEAEAFAAVGPHRARAAFALALAAIERGARDAASRWIDSLSVLARHDPVAAGLASVAAAHRAAAQGHLRTALDSSAWFAQDPGDAMALARGPLARAVTRFRRGSWHLALGDTASALDEWRWTENNDLQGWPDGPPQEGELDAALSPLVRLHRAVLECRGGDRRLGRALLSRVETLWAGAEAAVRELPVLREARASCR